MFVVLALTIGDRLSDGSLGLTNAEAILTDLARNRSAGIDTTRFLIIHEWRADLLAQSGDSETALDRYCQSLRIRERLVQANPDEPRYLRALAAAHGRVGDLLASMREDGRALDHYHRCQILLERLTAAEPDNMQYLHDLAASVRKNRLHHRRFERSPGSKDDS
jgi:hypothetical protein